MGLCDLCEICVKEDIQHQHVSMWSYLAHTSIVISQLLYIHVPKPLVPKKYIAMFKHKTSIKRTVQPYF